MSAYYLTTTYVGFASIMCLSYLSLEIANNKTKENATKSVLSSWSICSLCIASFIYSVAFQSDIGFGSLQLLFIMYIVCCCTLSSSSSMIYYS